MGPARGGVTLVTSLVALTMAFALAGCGGRDGSRVEPAPNTPASPVASTPAPGIPPGTSAAPSPGGATTRPAMPGTGWTTGPVTRGSTVPVPPVPVLVGIRTGAHDGYDRIVFDIRGPVPGIDVRYVPRVVEDGSGRTVTMPGRRFLQVRFTPLDAHDTSGRPTAPRGATVDLPMLEAYRLVGDFEAVVTVALGLDDTVAFRVGVLATPSRVYVDVAA